MIFRKPWLDRTLSESLDAKAYYDVGQFGFSRIKNFPNFTVGMGDFGIVGIEEFDGDTLVSVRSFHVTVDLMSVISGGPIKINEVAKGSLSLKHLHSVSVHL